MRLTNINFVNTGYDYRVMKSLVDDPHVDQGELSKALDKTKLVQKEVQVKGKDGRTHTRKQWVRAGEDPKADKAPAKQDDTGDKKPKADDDSNKPDSKMIDDYLSGNHDHDDGKSAMVALMQAGHSKGDVINAAKGAGVTWKESDNAGINWMRANMAIQGHVMESKNKAQSNSGDDKPTKAQDDTKDSSDLDSLARELGDGYEATEDSARKTHKLEDGTEVTIDVKQNNDGDYIYKLTASGVSPKFGGAKSVEEAKKAGEIFIESITDGEGGKPRFEPWNHTSEVKSKSVSSLIKTAKAVGGYEVDSADRADLDKNPPPKKVTLYKDGLEYSADFNRYSDGGCEFVNIKPVEKTNPNKGDKPAKSDHYAEKYGKLTEGDLPDPDTSEYYEAAAHNYVIGRLKANGDAPSEKTVKKAAQELVDQWSKNLDPSKNPDDQKNLQAEIDALKKIASGEADGTKSDESVGDKVSAAMEGAKNSGSTKELEDSIKDGSIKTISTKNETYTHDPARGVYVNSKGTSEFSYSKMARKLKRRAIGGQTVSVNGSSQNGSQKATQGANKPKDDVPKGAAPKMTAKQLAKKNLVHVDSKKIDWSKYEAQISENSPLNYDTRKALSKGTLSKFVKDTGVHGSAPHGVISIDFGEDFSGDNYRATKAEKGHLGVDVDEFTGFIGFQVFVKADSGNERERVLNGTSHKFKTLEEACNFIQDDLGYNFRSSKKS